MREKDCRLWVGYLMSRCSGVRGAYPITVNNSYRGQKTRLQLQLLNMLRELVTGATDRQSIAWSRKPNAILLQTPETANREQRPHSSALSLLPRSMACLPAAVKVFPFIKK